MQISGNVLHAKGLLTFLVGLVALWVILGMAPLQPFGSAGCQAEAERPCAEISAPLPATQDIVYNVLFDTSGQNMWGPGSSNMPDDETLSIISTAWNESDSTSDIRNVLGAQFGGSINASTSGKFDVLASFHDFDSGSIDVHFPIEVTLTKPVTFTPGQTITLGSNWRLLAGAAISTTAAQGHLDLIGAFEFNAAANASVCVFSCANFPFFPPIDTPVISGSMLAIDSTTPQTIDPVTADLTGISGTFGLPNVQTMSTIGSDGRTLIASGAHNNFVDITADLDKWATFVGAPPLGQGIPNFGVGVEASYDIWDITTNLKISQQQQFVFTPTVRVSLQFSQAVTFTVRNEAGVIIASGTSTQVTFEAGHHIDLILPPTLIGLTIIPTFSIQNTFSNETTTTFTQSLTNEVLKLTFKTPSVEITPEICPPIGPCIPAVNSPQVNVSLGPLFTDTRPLFSIDDPNLFDGDQPPWPLAGFRNVRGAAILIGKQQLYLPIINRL